MKIDKIEVEFDPQENLIRIRGEVNEANPLINISLNFIQEDDSITFELTKREWYSVPLKDAFGDTKIQLIINETDGSKQEHRLQLMRSEGILSLEGVNKDKLRNSSSKTSDTKKNDYVTQRAFQNGINNYEELKYQLKNLIDENKHLSKEKDILLDEISKLREDNSIYLDELQKFEIFNSLKPNEIDGVRKFIDFFSVLRSKLKFDVEALSSIVQPVTIDRYNDVMSGILKSWLAFFATDLYFDVTIREFERFTELTYSLDSLQNKFYIIAAKSIDVSFNKGELDIFFRENIESITMISHKLFQIRQITEDNRIIDFYEKFQTLFYSTRETLKISAGILNGY